MVTRHEEADAEGTQAEAGVARVREIQARIELVQHLNAIGVKAPSILRRWGRCITYSKQTSPVSLGTRSGKNLIAGVGGKAANPGLQRTAAQPYAMRQK